VIVSLRDGETITDLPGRRLVLLAAFPEMTVTWSRHAAGQEGTDLHVHRAHADAFYVLAGELTFPLGPEGTPQQVGAGGFVSVPPGVVHAFVNASASDVTWLNLHGPDGGFAAYLRGMRDGTDVSWDSHDPPADGGRPVSDVLVAHDGARVLLDLGVTVLTADSPDDVRISLTR
jgi:mannose-6-phosphate isomerase-like protein (cupin superfamily)